MARKAAAKTATEEKPEVKKVSEEKEEMVDVLLHKDADRYSGDVTVGLNGKNYKIQRGVPVKIPRPVYEVLMNSMMADADVANDIAKAEADSQFA